MYSGSWIKAEIPVFLCGAENKLLVPFSFFMIYNAIYFHYLKIICKCVILLHFVGLYEMFFFCIPSIVKWLIVSVNITLYDNRKWLLVCLSPNAQLESSCVCFLALFFGALSAGTAFDAK